MPRILVKISICLFLGGCASLPYQELASSSSYVGYGELELGNSKFQVSYHGKRDTADKLLRAYLAKRASELCKGDFQVQDIKKMVSISAHRVPIESHFIRGIVKCL